MAGDTRDRAAGPAFAGSRRRRCPDGDAAGPLLPRSRAGEGGRDQAAHPVAPGPAVLQRRRPRRERLDPGDPVPEAGCLELVAGTHLGPWLMPRTFLRGEARWFPEGSLAELPDIEADRGAFDIRRYELHPGDAIFFDFLTVHGAPGFPFT